jgi:hypothetical protein
MIDSIDKKQKLISLIFDLVISSKNKYKNIYISIVRNLIRSIILYYIYIAPCFANHASISLTKKKPDHTFVKKIQST